LNADLTLINEKINGFYSEFIFKQVMILTSDEFNNSSSMCINTAMVTVVVITGHRFSQLDTLTAFLNMLNMSNPSYQKYYNNIKKHTEDLAFDAMIDAGK
jgi:hypothetical protein